MEENEGHIVWNTRFYPLFEITRAIQKEKGLPLTTYYELVNLADIIKDYKNGDPATVKVVQESAKINAMTIFGLATILDIDCIVIEGKILDFGDEYLDLVRQDISRLSIATSPIRARIIPSSLKEESPMIGACYQAASIYFLDSVENATKERIDLPDFVIDKKYREI